MNVIYIASQHLSSDGFKASPLRCWLPDWGPVTHIFVGKLIIIGSDNGLSPGRREAIILNQWWNIVKWTLRHKLHWNLNRDLYIFVQENAFENVVWKMASTLSRAQCVNFSTQKNTPKAEHYHFIDLTGRDVYALSLSSPVVNSGSMLFGRYIYLRYPIVGKYMVGYHWSGRCLDQKDQRIGHRLPGWTQL